MFAALGLALSALSGCSFDPAGVAGVLGDLDGGGTEIDSAPPPPPDDADAAPPDSRPPPEPGAHLLLTEVKTQPNDEEFVEIFNPLAADVSLDDYFLTDDPDYGLLPGGELTVRNGDAVLGFPPGATLAAGGVIVVALDEQGFRDAFALDPDYAVEPASAPVAVAMEGVVEAPRRIDIVDTGEPIILFRWDGMTDLVTDVDIVVVGNEAPGPGTDNGLPVKSAVEVDGPDPDELTSQYRQDGAAMTGMSFRATNGGSYQRAVSEAGAEPSGGGNGVDGHDETSEDTLETWKQVDAPPTARAVAPELLE